MKSGGQKIQRFLASLESALLAAEKEPGAVADVEQFLALLSELSAHGLPGEPTTPGRKLPVCSHWQGAIEAALDRPSGKMAQVLDDCRDDLIWIQSEDYLRSPPSPDFVDNYGYAVVAGPQDAVPALVSTDRLAAGVMLFGPRSCYPLHQHPAIELYYVISGSAEWWRDDGPWLVKGPGALIHHASGIPHAMRTSAEPLIVAYLWKGDLHTDARFIE
jgi:quercetin dioxygenase-like cupin family protein